MAVDLVSKLNLAGLGKVSSPATGVVQRVSNPITQTTRHAIEILDKTYGRSPVTTGSGVGDVFDSNRWLGL